MRDPEKTINKTGYQFLSLKESEESLTALADTYLDSASKIKKQLNQIKSSISPKEKKEPLNENREIILQAEYYYLIRTAHYLKNYYSR